MFLESLLKDNKDATANTKGKGKGKTSKKKGKTKGAAAAAGANEGEDGDDDYDPSTDTKKNNKKKSKGKNKGKGTPTFSLVDFRENHTDRTVDFLLNFTAEKELDTLLGTSWNEEKAEEEKERIRLCAEGHPSDMDGDDDDDDDDIKGDQAFPSITYGLAERRDIIAKALKLGQAVSISNMNCYDAKGRMKGFTDPLDIVRAFFPIRMRLYQQRKAYQIGVLEVHVYLFSF